MTTVSSTLDGINNNTAETIANTSTSTGTASATLSQSEFLNLMLMQYQYQDPMEPLDNAEMVSQQCQFAQLTTAQSQSSTTTEMQASNLIGESVTLKNPEDQTKTIKGTVTSATIKGEDSAITVNGTSYPLKYLLYVNNTTASTSTETTTGGTTDDTKTKT